VKDIDGAFERLDAVGR